MTVEKIFIGQQYILIFLKSGGTPCAHRHSLSLIYNLSIPFGELFAQKDIDESVEVVAVDTALAVDVVAAVVVVGVLVLVFS